METIIYYHNNKKPLRVQLMIRIKLYFIFENTNNYKLQYNT